MIAGLHLSYLSKAVVMNRSGGLEPLEVHVVCLPAQSRLTLWPPWAVTLETGVGCHALLQGIFPIEGSNPGLLHCRQILYHLSLQGIYALANLFYKER